MADCSDQKNPLIHNGSSQAQRLLPGMTKDYALVDEKDYADWIVFANEFSTYINYYSIANGVAGDWQPFFSNDVAAQLGIFAIQDIENYRWEIKERLDYIKDDDNQSSLIRIEKKLNELFSAILTLSKAIDDQYSKLPSTTSLRGTIQNLIKSKLAPALNRFIAYYKGAKSRGFITDSLLEPSKEWKLLTRKLTKASEIINSEHLSNNDWLYNTNHNNWVAYVNSILVDDSIFNHPLTAFTDEFLCIEHAANHNLLTSIFDTYLTTYTKIIKEAESELLNTLENYNSHTPHYTLFLCFLKLFRFSQKHINTLTDRHLEFYYKEVLKLLPKKAEANKVHVLGNLAKQVDNHSLVKGTALKAGKDSLKKDVSYVLDADTVFNKASVAQLKTYYKGSADDNVYETGTSTLKIDNLGRVFASSVTNSDDGSGAELTSTNKEYHPYVHKLFKEGELSGIAMPKAQLGFALASHYLYLTEGERKVFIRLALNLNSVLEGKNLECWLTTQKGWYKVESLGISSSGKLLSDSTACVELSFTIPGSAPAIENYNSKVHGGTIDCALPVLKIYLWQEDTNPYEYDILKDLTITYAEIGVEVGMEGTYSQKGLKNLLLSNDFGVLDGSKPFMPFGSQPKKDTGFVIGHKEIFSKNNTSIKLNVEWADLPDEATKIKYDQVGNVDTPQVIRQFLQGGIWKSSTDDGVTIESFALFDSVAPSVQLFTSGMNIPIDALSDYDDEYPALNGLSINGFLRLALQSSFSQNEYIRDLSKYFIEMSPAITSKTITTEPIEPYTPKINSLYASYSSNCNCDLSAEEEDVFNNREIRFYHLYPFGEAEQHKYLQPNADVFLLPQFKHTHKEAGIPSLHIGEFYIGIENLTPGEAVNILFQVLEGSTDPTVAKPNVQHLHWFYLANNQWTEFNDDEYSDNTLELVQSGIISFAVPKLATTNHTVLPTGYIWIKAAITEAPGAVCELLTVSAQAAVATFQDNGNADDFLETALPASTISKLKTPDASIKSFNQPYPSFGGRSKESGDHFYIRVSERLRHKARAITVWDYEHMVLEAFPEIYKVKCLNHTQIEDGNYNEVKPGYVAIITIPSLLNRNDANPLKPYTQQSILTQIEDYLRKHISCFVNLHACQPQFEEVRMEFSLSLHKQFQDFTFYSNKLKEEITQFLSPWVYNNSSDLDFGGKIYKSVLIDFIEERNYVDLITDVKMYVRVDEFSTESEDRDEITASTSRSILVSSPASKHIIHLVDENEIKIVQECPDLEMKEVTENPIL